MKQASKKPPSAKAPAAPREHGKPVQSRARAALGAICERIIGGTPINHACALEGVPRQSFYDLLERDEEAAVWVEKARAEAADRLRENIVELAQGGVQGANPNVLLHLAERLYPAEYGPPKERREVELTGKDGGAVTMSLTLEQAIAGARDGSIPGEDGDDGQE